VQLLNALMRDLLPGGVAEPDRVRNMVERPPGYVQALMQSQEELQGADRGTTARRLVLIVV